MYSNNNYSFVWITAFALLTSMVSCESASSTLKEKVDIVRGCMDTNALNYDSLSTEDDGSCQYYGCTDSSAYNYDPDATNDDGNCISPSLVPDGWELVWNDEFNADAINEAKWNHESWAPGRVNNELQEYTRNLQNSGVNQGYLYITARKNNPFDAANPVYNSARMHTRRKGDWKYGRVEVRAKMPRGQGLWPAIWMMPSYSVYGGWPVSGEIDIMEFLGHDLSRVYGTIHYGNYYPDKSSTGTSYVLPAGDFSESFHTFALEWEANELRWYVDDILYQTLNNWYSIGGEYPAPFDQEFHLILNVAVGGEWPGNPDPSTLFPQTMLVDYVRIFQ
ncbi:MAG: glycoside hydrolase family 16 protein [Candidatus Marinimicrobia bacterium]|nr:glycoside hydrolase family 16 protein [Candidatus Neomarinimicrobiota bacterium]